MNKIVSIKGTSVELFKKDIYGLNENGTYLITKYSLYVSKDNEITLYDYDVFQSLLIRTKYGFVHVDECDFAVKELTTA